MVGCHCQVDIPYDRGPYAHNCRCIYNTKTSLHIYLTMTSDDAETSFINFANILCWKYSVKPYLFKVLTLLKSLKFQFSASAYYFASSSLCWKYSVKPYLFKVLTLLKSLKFQFSASAYYFASSTWTCECDDTLHEVLHEVCGVVHHNSE